MNMRIGHVPIQVNPKTRESRLISSVPTYLCRSASIILRSYLTYKPLRTFFYLSLAPTIIGIALCVRFLYFFFFAKAAGHIQSIMLAVLLLLIGFGLITLGIVADLISANRKLIQDVLFSTRSQIYARSKSQRQRPE